jgi:hypothetical protein
VRRTAGDDIIVLLILVLSYQVGRVAQSVKRLTTGWTVRGSNPGGGKIFRIRPDRPCVPPSLVYDGYRFFPVGKAAGAWC